MAKTTLKEKELQKKKEARRKKGYNDYKILIRIVLFSFLLQAPAVLTLLTRTSVLAVIFGVIMVVANIGYVRATMLLAHNKEELSVIYSLVSGALIILCCVLVYVNVFGDGYSESMELSDSQVPQIIVSYVIPAISVPLANIIMVKRRG